MNFKKAKIMRRAHRVEVHADEFGAEIQLTPSSPVGAIPANEIPYTRERYRGMVYSRSKGYVCSCHRQRLYWNGSFWACWYSGNEPPNIRRTI